MQNFTGSKKRTGLLETEEAKLFFRSKINAEIAEIPQPVLEEPTSQEAAEPFLRSQRRVPVRRRRGTKFASRLGWGAKWVRLLAAALIVAGLALIAAGALAVKSLLLHNQHFFLRSTEDIQVNGNRVVTQPEALAFFASDIGRSIFRVPLAKRQAALEQIKWVRLATVMRLWPDRLRVTVVERTPIAFARDGNRVRLVDDQGVLLDLPEAVAQHYSFPVLDGISAADPLPIRAARVEMYRQFIHALDADGGHVSPTLSEVDLSDPEDIRAVFLGGARQPLVHFGDSDFLPRYQSYQAHLAEWLQQYPRLRSVDMRYGKQIVLDTGADESSASPSENSVNNDSASTQSSDTSETAGQAVGTSMPLVSSAKPTGKTAVAKRHRTTRHQETAKHARVSRHQPQRGHTVRHPIMHVVAGM